MLLLVPLRLRGDCARRRENRPFRDLFMSRVFCLRVRYFFLSLCTLAPHYYYFSGSKSLRFPLPTMSSHTCTTKKTDKLQNKPKCTRPDCRQSEIKPGEYFVAGIAGRRFRYDEDKILVSYLVKWDGYVVLFFFLKKKKFKKNLSRLFTVLINSTTQISDP